MRRRIGLMSLAAVLLGFSIVSIAQQSPQPEAKAVPDVLNYKMKSLAGEDVDLSKYQGKVILMVNVASKCGFTPQYTGLEAVYKKYQGKGLVVMGFPANNFGAQEPGTDKDIADFCTANYGVTFPMFSKISVKGTDIDPLYKLLTTQEQAKTKETGDVQWNFEKFLIGRDGKLAGRYRPRMQPNSTESIAAIEAELAKPVQ